MHLYYWTWRYQLINAAHHVGDLIPYCWQIRNFAPKSNCIEEFLLFNQNDTTSHSLLWETLKSYIRGQIISYCASAKKKLNSRLSELTSAISNQTCALNPTPQLFKQRVHLQTEFDLLSTKEAERLLLHTRSSYYEHGDKAGRL